MHVYIQWSEAKRRKNLEDHGVDFAGLAQFFDGDLLTEEDIRYDYPERRFASIGLHRFIVVLVVWTPVDAEWAAVRLISARKATQHETQTWFEHYSIKHQGSHRLGAAAEDDRCRYSLHPGCAAYPTGFLGERACAQRAAAAGA